MTKDDIYRHPRSQVPPFEFDRQVARVFNDMINRSVPFYHDIVNRQVQLIERFYQPGTTIYDLGCANGNIGLLACRKMENRPFQMIAVDNSVHMLDAYRKRLEGAPGNHRVTLKCRDICQMPIENASIVVLNYTQQFLPPSERGKLVSNIFAGLNTGGVLLFCEKITHENNLLAALQIDFYHKFKRENGYSKLEISQKREALENVLIPETMEQHLERLQQAGFQAIDVWQKWFNFAAVIAIK